ncbi:RNA pol II accessory factor, Cdc73 family-domain-containing protein [Chytriomyces cf. hyalinus JEL632]|nr:RNA pol II accessory factor, Cdc73 family-domain-containing protein [Chytriomyces cf. hyalinus JEL632]
MASPAPVSLLRANNHPRLMDRTGSETQELKDAVDADFGTDKVIFLSCPHRKPVRKVFETAKLLTHGYLLQVSLSASSGFKAYPLASLLFFLLELTKGTDHAAYMQKALAYWGDRDVPVVSFMDRKNLADYLSGASDSALFLSSLVGATVGADSAAKNDDSLSNSLKRKADGLTAMDPAARTFDSANESVENEAEKKEVAAMLESISGMQDFERIRDTILSRERTILNPSNFLSNKVTKNFTNAIKYAAEILKPAPAAKPSTRPSDPKARTSSSNPGNKQPPTAQPSSSRNAPSKPPSSSSQKPSSSKPGQKPSASARIPIIIVPPSVTSVITLFNAKPFLCEAKFQSTEECSKSGAEKPTMLVLERKGAPQGYPKQYHVFDSVDRLKPEDWDRIVAVFATGQEWQFKNWKLGPPVNIFSRVKGFCLKYVEDPINDKIKTWNVNLLNIHRSKRHLDAQTVNDFWLGVEAFIKEHKSAQYLR